MPRRQHELPHTAGKPGPCDAARDAWLDACEQAKEAADERRRRKDELVDRMLETGTARVPCVDPRTKRVKWLELSAGEPRLKAVKAEAADRAENGRQCPRSEFNPDEPGTGQTGTEALQRDSTPPEVDETGSDATPDLRTPGQQRRGARR